MWQLGEVDRAREPIEELNKRASELGNAPSMAHPLLWTSHLEILRGDPAEALIAAETLQGLGQERGIAVLAHVRGIDCGVGARSSL